EFVNEKYIDTVKITPDIDTESVEFIYQLPVEMYLSGNLVLETTITFDQLPIKTFNFGIERHKHTTTLNIASNYHHWKVWHWSPESPNLYDIEFTLYKDHEVVDKVKSYFGMRKISIENGNVLLNNIPIYQRLLLDQGYWQDSHLTPPSEEAILE